MNDAWRNFFGLIDEVIRGRSLFEFVPAWHQAQVKADLLALGRTRRAASHRHAAGFGDLTLAWIDWTYRVTLDQRGRAIVYDAIGYLAPEGRVSGQPRS